MERPPLIGSFKSQQSAQIPKGIEFDTAASWLTRKVHHLFGLTIDIKINTSDGKSTIIPVIKESAIRYLKMQRVEFDTVKAQKFLEHQYVRDSLQNFIDAGKSRNLFAIDSSISKKLGCSESVDSGSATSSTEPETLNNIDPYLLIYIIEDPLSSLNAKKNALNELRKNYEIYENLTEKDKENFDLALIKEFEKSDIEEFFGANFLDKYADTLLNLNTSSNQEFDIYLDKILKELSDDELSAVCKIIEQKALTSIKQSRTQTPDQTLLSIKNHIFNSIKEKIKSNMFDLGMDVNLDNIKQQILGERFIKLPISIKTSIAVEIYRAFGEHIGDKVLRGSLTDYELKLCKYANNTRSTKVFLSSIPDKIYSGSPFRVEAELILGIFGNSVILDDKLKHIFDEIGKRMQKI